jgi:hypothetical protein
MTVAALLRQPSDCGLASMSAAATPRCTARRSRTTTVTTFIKLGFDIVLPSFIFAFSRRSLSAIRR